MKFSELLLESKLVKSLPDLIDKENLKLDAVKGIYPNTVNDDGGAASDAGLKEKRCNCKN